MDKIKIELKREEWDLITKALNFNSDPDDAMRIEVHYLAADIEKQILKHDGELIDISDEDIPF